MTFTTLLVANRGEIARRILRAARAMGLTTVGVYVEADADAPFVAECDQSVLIPSYLDGDAILDAARRTGAQAVHPGYGFLSENAAFAARVENAGLVWIGPPAVVIEQMGDKLAAKQRAREAGVPTLPSCEDPAEADAIGYPLLVKAAAGGGGKGMRIVTAPDQLDEAVAGARREAASGFGDDRVFLERYVASSRHVEIQILGDAHGHLVHLGERECSIQRRHQKLIEESPSPVVDDAMREAMGAAALQLARALNYRSTGTVEFLVDNSTRDFYFLEVNTRLQVEHPVTEEVTDIDLVVEQIRVAQGEELDFTQDDVEFYGHAIEVRLCAEDPATGFLPATGTLFAFEPAEEPAVRWESGVEAGSRVTVAFDPMLAKVIAHAPTRPQAATVLARALERLHLGGVTTNRDLLVSMLRHEAFLAGDTTTDFIERHVPRRSLEPDEAELAWAARAGALWLAGENRRQTPVLAEVPSGWRNARLPRQRTTLRHGDASIDVDYAARRDGSFDVGGAVARVHRASPLDIDVEIDGRRACVRVTRSDDRLFVQSLRGTVEFHVVPRFVPPGVEAVVGGLDAPMPGIVTDIRVMIGEPVTAGQTLVVMEAMKMEHLIAAPYAGVVAEIFVAVGQQVDGAETLLRLDSEETA